MIVVRAADAGLVETIAVTNGGLVEAGAPVLVVLQPEKVRFRAHALQSDLGRLRDGLAARIVPPVGGTIALDDSMTGTLELAPAADADARTIGLLVTPASLARWARAGVAGYLELVLAGGREELAIPSSAVVRDGTVSVIFRRDPANADKVIRLEADLGVSDGRWVELRSGVKLGDEIVVGGNYQLMLASSGSAPKGGHFHSDGTFHEGED
jgi:multidrug efflux pump subunit AcrA (membrane-fusion protein)